MPIRFIAKTTSPPQYGYTDDSPVENTVVPVNMEYSVDSKFGISSGNFTGSNYMTIASNSNLELGLIWTIRAWIKTTTTGQQYFLQFYEYGEGEAAPKPGGYTLGIANASGYAYMTYASDGVDGFLSCAKLGNVNICTGDWVHFEFVRNGINSYGFINGQTIPTSPGENPSASDIMGSPSLPFSLGRASNGLFPYTGLIDEVEIIKGVALHTSNFTPPTEASTPTANHVLLMHLDDDGAV